MIYFINKSNFYFSILESIFSITRWVNFAIEDIQKTSNFFSIPLEFEMFNVEHQISLLQKKVFDLANFSEQKKCEMIKKR